MADNQPRTTPPTNLQHFNRLLSAFAETDEGMPVSRARHALSVVAICSRCPARRPTSTRRSSTSLI